MFSKRLKRKHAGFGDTFFIDEVFVNIKGDPKAGKRFFWRLLRAHGEGPRKIVTDSSTACSIYNAIWYRRRFTGSVGCVHSNLGNKQSQDEDVEPLLLFRRF